MSHNPHQNPNLTVCHHHPNLSTTTGLCAPCLHHRLSLLNPSTSTTTTTVLPDLRRCKTFSSNHRETNVAHSTQPRRRSCDVRFRNSLSTLFNISDNVGEVREDEINCEFVKPSVSNFSSNVVDCLEDSRTMKEFIDLEFRSNTNKINRKKDFKLIAGGLLVSASKKLRKWRKKDGNARGTSDCNGGGDGCGSGLGDMRLERLRGRRLRDTQSEVGEYGVGRRSCDSDPRFSIDFGRASIDCGTFGMGRSSCDVDPRFSIDIGRVSVDEGRCSFDASRASCDGYFTGRRSLPCGSGPMVSVIEDAMASVYGFDHRVEVDGKVKMDNEGTSFKQLDKKGFDGSSSINGAIDVVNGPKVLITEKDFSDLRLNSCNDDSSENFETASKDLASVSSSSNGNSFKKCRQWSSKLWSVWSFLHRKKSEQCLDEDKLSTARNSNKETGSDPHRKFGLAHRSELNLERSRSAKYSPNYLDNGLLRFYLTPSRSRRRSKPGRSRLKNSPSLARTRSVLR